MSSFAKVQRSLFKSDLWLIEREFSEAEAYLDLLRRAAFCPQKLNLFNREINLQTNQLICSSTAFSQAWNRPPQKVEKLFIKLEKLGALERNLSDGVQIITHKPNFDFPPAKNSLNKSS